MAVVTLFLLAALFIAMIVAYFKFIYRSRRANEPPIVKGNFLLGNSKDFGQHAVKFLHDSRDKYGDVFTIRLLNQYITIIMDPHSFENVSKERSFDFEAIQKQVNKNVFSFELKDAKTMIKNAGKTVRGNHMITGMRNFGGHLDDSYKTLSTDINGNISSSKSEWQTDGLRSLSSKTLFSAIFYTIFGKGADGSVFEPNVVYKKFDIFHKYFNYMWLGMPVGWFPKANDALQVLCQQPSSDELLEREDLSEYVRCAIKFMKANGQTEQDIIGHNLVYLHVNYNTYRLAYWCIYNLLENEAALEALNEEIDAVVVDKVYDDKPADGEPIRFETEDLDKMEILDSVINESMRLASGVFMVRYITEDIDFALANGKEHRLRKGDRVAIYPPSIHQDPEIFEDPLVFKYDRFVDATFFKDGKVVKHPVIAFGSRCPGQQYALRQLKWYIISLVHQFDLKLPAGEHTEYDNHYHGHEILPPTHDVNIQYKRKEHCHNLRLL